MSNNNTEEELLQGIIGNGNFDPVVDQIFPNQELDRSYRRNRIYFGYSIPQEFSKTQNPISKSKVIPLETLEKSINSNQFDFVCFPVPPSAPTHKRASVVLGLHSRQILRASDWSSNVCGEISDQIFSDLSIPIDEAEKCLLQEYKFMFHLSIPGISLPIPLPGSEVRYAKLLNLIICHEFFSTPLYVSIPLFDPKTDYYEVFNKIIRICQYHPLIGVNLIITEDLPDSFSDVTRWIGESLCSLTIPTKIFQTKLLGDKKTHKKKKKRAISIEEFEKKRENLTKITLTIIHTRIIRLLFPFVQNTVLEISHLSKDTITPVEIEKLDVMNYLEYLRKLANTLPKRDAIESYIDPYRDVVQIPLQPLARNLTNITYALFEKDPVKYNYYEEAVKRSLIRQNKLTPNRDVIVMVLGAGRGPLVKAVFRASFITKIGVSCFAVEKNENAIVVLTALNKDIWDNKVQIIEKDIRSWKPPVKADIVVSELLGSFGDNELSPECLFPIPRFLQPKTGISIPCSSTSFLVPASSSKIHQEMIKLCETKPEWRDMGCVTNIYRAFLLDKPKPCFYFSHPDISVKKIGKDGNINFSRFVELEFKASANSRIDGLIGYFESSLFDDKEKNEVVKISIKPDTHTPHMFSWFPIWFPCGDFPIDVKRGEKIKVSMWRCQDNKRVWYEWQVCVNNFSTRFFNALGCSYSIEKS